MDQSSNASDEVSEKKEDTQNKMANSLFELRTTDKFNKEDPRWNGPIGNLTDDHENPKANSCKAMFLSFSIQKSWHSLYSSKCKLWDDKELDVIEGFKFFSYALGQFCLTSQFLMCTQTINPWMIERFFQQYIFAIVIDSNMVMEIFTTLSAFLGAYKLFQLYDAQGYISVLDCCKFWARKFIRLAPFYYFCFFVGWAIFPKMGAGPLWFTASTMYTDC